MRSLKLYLAVAVVLIAAVALTLSPFPRVNADVPEPASTAMPAPVLKSIGALEIGPDGVLFAADSEGAAIYAFEIQHPSVEKPASAGEGRIETLVEDLDEKLAALLGTSPRDLAIQDMAVHEPSATTYLSILRGRDDAAKPVLMSVARDGSVAEVRLEGVPYTRLALADAPAEDAKLYHWSSRSFTVTDLELIDGELYVAGLSNEEFASVLRRVPYPFTDGISAVGLEIFHGAHGEYETFAPIFSFAPFDIGGKAHLLAGYLCTPLVTFPLDQVKTKDRLRGKTIAELGWGNIPTDLVPFEVEGKDYVLVVNNRRGNMVFKGSDIVSAQARDGITQEAAPRTGLVDHSVALGNVVQAATFDRDNVLVLGRSMENGSLSLQAVPTGRLWRG